MKNAFYFILNAIFALKIFNSWLFGVPFWSCRKNGSNRMLRLILKYVYCNSLFPCCDVINFETNLIFLIKPFFFMTKKSRQKFKYLRKKAILRWNKKHFSLFLKGFQLPKIVSDFKCETPLLFLLHIIWSAVVRRCSSK